MQARAYLIVQDALSLYEGGQNRAEARYKKIDHEDLRKRWPRALVIGQVIEREKNMPRWEQHTHTPECISSEQVNVQTPESRQASSTIQPGF